MRTVAAIALMLVWSPTLAAGGDIYVWRDRTGVSHYTTDRASIPEEYRGGAAPVAREWDRGEPPPESPERSGDTRGQPVRREAAPEPAATDDDRGDARAYDDGYVAGLLAAQVSAGPTVAAVAASTVAPVIAITVPERRRDVLVPFVPVGRHHARKPVARPPERRPVTRGSFSAAGPPPLGAAGPPPFSPGR